MDTVQITPDSESTPPSPHGLTYETRGDDRLISVLYRKVEEVEKKLHELQTKKIIDETQLPLEVLENNELLPRPPRKVRRGRGYRPILQSEIEEAKKHGMSAASQAKWLGIHLATYKRYSKMYGIWTPHPNIKGKARYFDPARGVYSLNKILAGEYNGNPAISDWVVKKKLILSGTIPPKCNICGYDKQRILDNRICLLLDHIDGDLTNYNGANLQLLCLNCTFECGRGYIRRGKRVFDPDWMQGRELKDCLEKP